MACLPANGYPSQMKLPRSWPKSALLALLTLYLPLVVPFAVGPLTECDHCVSSYLAWAPIVPGVAMSFVLLGIMSQLFFVAAGAVTLALLVCCVFTARRLSTRSLLVVHVPLMVLVGLEACAFAALLRA